MKSSVISSRGAERGKWEVRLPTKQDKTSLWAVLKQQSGEAALRGTNMHSKPDGFEVFCELRMLHEVAIAIMRCCKSERIVLTKPLQFVTLEHGVVATMPL